MEVGNYELYNFVNNFRSILKDNGDPSRRNGSANDTRNPSNRPQTVNDRKAVRFADQDSVEVITARNRSRLVEYQDTGKMSFQ